METDDEEQGPLPPKRRRCESESKCGIIESISLKNFTCHGMLTIPNFNKNINILIGRNSSGKSSILAAILIGLGGTAAMTNRGSVVKSFIKEGRRVAQVTISLSNIGVDESYKHEVYGDSIIVERKLYAEGKSIYAIKSKRGIVISRAKAELNSILDHFNIQLNNPITLLNQDSSRTFLASSNPRQLYKFFLCSTQLHQIKLDYMEILERKSATIDSITKRRQQLDDLKAEVRKWEDKVKGLVSLDELIQKRDGLFSLAAWAQVKELEKDHEAVIRQLGTYARKMDQIEASLHTETEASENAKAQHASCEKDVKELERRIGEVETLHAGSREIRKELQTDLRQLKRNIKKDLTELQSREDDVKDYRARIDEEKKRDEEEIAAERQARLAEMAKREDAIQRLNVTSRELEVNDDKNRDDIKQLKEAMTSNRADEMQAKALLQTLKRKLDSLEAGRKDHLKLYGQHVPQIVAEIDKNHRQGQFHRKPKGPLGAFIKVKIDPKAWCLAIEQCLGSLLYSFSCHDQHDTKILRGILDKVVSRGNPVPKILTTKFEDEHYDIRRNLVQCQDHPSFLDLVQIDDPVIFNIVVDQRGVEHILFIRDKMTAQQILKYSPPVNCREGYTMEGDHIYAGTEQRFYSGPKGKKSRLLQGNIDDAISEFKEDIIQQTSDLAAMSGQAEEFKKRLKEMELRQTELSREKREISTRIVCLQSELSTLREEEKTEASALVIEGLEQELSECLDQVSTLRRSVGRLREQYQECVDQLKRTEEECKKIDQEMESLFAEIDPLKEKLVAVSVEVETRKKNIEHYSKKKDDLIKKRNDLIQQREQRKIEIDETTEKARRICEERVDCDRTRQSIDSEISEITKRIDKEQRRHGDPMEIKQNYERAVETYRMKTQHIDRMDRFIKDLEGAMYTRQRAFIEFRKRITVRTKCEFIGNMSQRGFSAQLHFDHKKEELLIKIDVDSDKQHSDKDKDEARSLLQLSGGEKSFSTVCLLMSLWNSVESPFLAMDEFDVCMDMVNRRVTLESLMWFGEQNKSTQFLFISPLDMSLIQPSRFLTIHQLRGPRERNGPRTDARTEEEEEESH